jgi:hypothetical protein
MNSGSHIFFMKKTKPKQKNLQRTAPCFGTMKDGKKMNLNLDPLLHEKIKVLLLVMETSEEEIKLAIEQHERLTGKRPNTIEIPISLTITGVKINFRSDNHDGKLVTQFNKGPEFFEIRHERNKNG